MNYQQQAEEMARKCAKGLDEFPNCLSQQAIYETIRKHIPLAELLEAREQNSERGRLITTLCQDINVLKDQNAALLEVAKAAQTYLGRPYLCEDGAAGLFTALANLKQQGIEV